jgi:membrane protein YdbS with pleckstrin-like domain
VALRLLVLGAPVVLFLLLLFVAGVGALFGRRSNRFPKLVDLEKELGATTNPSSPAPLLKELVLVRAAMKEGRNREAMAQLSPMLKEHLAHGSSPETLDLIGGLLIETLRREGEHDNARDLQQVLLHQARGVASSTAHDVGHPSFIGRILLGDSNEVALRTLSVIDALQSDWRPFVTAYINSIYWTSVAILVGMLIAIIFFEAQGSRAAESMPIFAFLIVALWLSVLGYRAYKARKRQKEAGDSENVLLRAVTLVAVVVIVGVMLSGGSHPGGQMRNGGSAEGTIAFVALVLWLIVIGYLIYVARTTRYEVTNGIIRITRGGLSRVVNPIELYRVHDVEVIHSPINRFSGDCRVILHFGPNLPSVTLKGWVKANETNRLQMAIRDVSRALRTNPNIKGILT